MIIMLFAKKLQEKCVISNCDNECVLSWQKIYKEKGIENYEESIGSCRHAK